jgi:hypothetical protein
MRDIYDSLFSRLASEGGGNVKCANERGREDIDISSIAHTTTTMMCHRKSQSHMFWIVCVYVCVSEQ